MNMVTPIGRPDQLLGALRDKLGAAAVLIGTDVPARSTPTPGKESNEKTKRLESG